MFRLRPCMNNWIIVRVGMLYSQFDCCNNSAKMFHRFHFILLTSLLSLCRLRHHRSPVRWRTLVLYPLLLDWDSSYFSLTFLNYSCPGTQSNPLSYTTPSHPLGFARQHCCPTLLWTISSGHSNTVLSAPCYHPVSAGERLELSRIPLLLLHLAQHHWVGGLLAWQDTQQGGSAGVGVCHYLWVLFSFI